MGIFLFQGIFVCLDLVKKMPLPFKAFSGDTQAHNVVRGACGVRDCPTVGPEVRLRDQRRANHFLSAKGRVACCAGRVLGDRMPLLQHECASRPGPLMIWP